MRIALSLVEFYSLLESHDWFYEHAQSETVYTQGVREKWNLLEIAKTSEDHGELYRSFYLHKFAKGEKPDRVAA